MTEYTKEKIWSTAWLNCRLSNPLISLLFPTIWTPGTGYCRLLATAKNSKTTIRHTDSIPPGLFLQLPRISFQNLGFHWTPICHSSRSFISGLGPIRLITLFVHCFPKQSGKALLWLRDTSVFTNAVNLRDGSRLQLWRTGAKRRQKELSDIYCNKSKNKGGEFYPRGGGRGGKGVLKDAQGIF